VLQRIARNNSRRRVCFVCDEEEGEGLPRHRGGGGERRYAAELEEAKFEALKVVDGNLEDGEGYNLK
jgi:hypothetical protein